MVTSARDKLNVFIKAIMHKTIQIKWITLLETINLNYCTNINIKYRFLIWARDTGHHMKNMNTMNFSRYQLRKQNVNVPEMFVLFSYMAQQQFVMDIQWDATESSEYLC